MIGRSDMFERCEKCGKLTDAGRNQVVENSRKNPIWKTDFSIPLSKIVEEARHKIVDIRGTLHDIEHAYPGWGDHVDDAIGGLTCVIVALYEVAQRMRSVEDQKSAQ